MNRANASNYKFPETDPDGLKSNTEIFLIIDLTSLASEGLEYPRAWHGHDKAPSALQVFFLLLTYLVD
jgi:hypothetical protein